MQKQKINFSKLKLSSIVVFIFGLLGFLGSFSLTAVGTRIYTLMENYLGEIAWLAPFLFLILAVIGWFSSAQPLFRVVDQSTSQKRSKQNNKNGKNENNSKNNRRGPHHGTLTSSGQSGSREGIEPPPSKLVSLQGFDQYFASPELHIQAATRADLDEIGTDFDSYFKKDQRGYSLPRRFQSVNGFRDYFRSSSDEIEMGNGFSADRFALSGASANQNTPELVPTPPSIPNYVPIAYRNNEIGNKTTMEITRENTSETVYETSNENTIKNINENNLVIVPTENSDGHTFNSDADCVPIADSDYNCTDEPMPASDLQLDVEDFQDAMNDTPSEKFSEMYSRDEVRLVDEQAKPPEEKRKWNLPDVRLLNPLPRELQFEEYEDNSQVLEQVLHNFGIKCQVVDVTRGPVVTRYELVPAPGVKISRIVSLTDDIALALAAKDVRIEAPIPGKSAIGIEVPNKQSRVVCFREVIESEDYRKHPSPLKVALGMDIAGKPVVADLVKMPHLLVAGATGSGKSVCINSLIFSILFNATPDQVKLMLIDPKMVELSNFNGIPHLITPVVTDSRAASSFLKWAVKEMETRYELFAARGVRDINAFNALCRKDPTQADSTLPLIVIVIDELADLMMVSAHEVEEAIARLAQMARAAGIHLIIATQRPSVDVITGVIKANIPSRVAFAVSSQIDSRTILDSTGAERLLGKGDMLFSPIGLNKPLRVQGCFIDDEEANRVIEHWKRQGKPEYLAPETILGSPGDAAEAVNSGDELFLEAARLVVTTGMASASYLQRKLKVGYARAARLIDLLEEEGVIGGYEGPKPRQVLMDLEQLTQRYSL